MVLLKINSLVLINNFLKYLTAMLYIAFFVPYYVFTILIFFAWKKTVKMVIFVLLMDPKMIGWNSLNFFHL